MPKRLLFALSFFIFSVSLLLTQVNAVDAVDTTSPLTSPITAPITSTITPTITPPITSPTTVSITGKVTYRFLGRFFRFFSRTEAASDITIKAVNTKNNQTMTSTTNASGNYSLNLPDGRWRIAPLDTSITERFSPRSRIVHVRSNKTKNNVNFQGLVLP